MAIPFLKSIIFRVYNLDGTFIKVWSDASFETFSKKMNGGLSECVIELARRYDASSADLALGNIVEVSVSDTDTQTQNLGDVLIYRGYISIIEPSAERSQQKVTVHVMGFYTLLDLDILKNGTTTTLYTDTTNGLTTSASGSAADLGLVMRAIIDRFRAENSTKIGYDSSTIPLTSTTATFKFEFKTYYEALEKIKDLAPSNYYWYINERGLLTFRGKPTTATHSFIFSKHVKSLTVQSNMEKVRNFVVVFNGESSGVLKHYQDDASIALYGRRAARLIEYGISDTDAADKLGGKFLSENKDPEITITAEIMDNNGDANRGYDIESIQPGDSCSFFDFNDATTNILRENMIITGVDYFIDHVRITAEIFKTGALAWQDQTSSRVDDINTSNTPANYT